ncbi:DNA replication factor Cdt1 [Orchesella cincta]|uniref:DNA replication factor Cdt1 n=1 Tax=Orchesella cincta TaxID=48709 RepID=A0A1D2MIU7_ORCCI|nr:DNA replication factor Cdt1 [Orchesella cincta]
MSASPLITQFFKAQRKRPRSSGKDEGVIVSTSKRLLLEEGIVATGAEALSIAKSSDEKSLKLVTAEEPPPPVKSVVVEVEHEAKSQTEEKNESEIPQTSSSTKTDGENKEETRAVAPSSPIKFLKVGSLSPTKKSKQLTTEQVAKLLKNKTNLRDLKSALEGINNCTQKISEFRRTVAEANAKLPTPVKPTDSPKKGKSTTPRRSGVKSVTPSKFYSPKLTLTPTTDRDRGLIERLSAGKVGSPSKLVGLNSKVKKRLFDEEPSDKEKPDVVPAYQRFHNLAQKTPPEKQTVEEEINLPLPYHFKILKELFMAVETVITIMKGRKEMITFPKLKAGVLELVRKLPLREKHLAQMVTVLPGCYSFGLEKNGKATVLRIIVEGSDLVPSVIVSRRKAFHAGLLKICEDAHLKFLTEKLVPPIIIPEGKKITRWHPRFMIDEVVDIIPKEGTLPVKPEESKLSSAREVIARAQTILENANPRMKEAMKNMLKGETNKNEAEGEKNPKVGDGKAVKSSSTSTSSLKGLKGVSQSLLEKIRNREREKLLSEMTRSPAESKKLLMIKRMPNFQPSEHG